MQQEKEEEEDFSNIEDYMNAAIQLLEQYTEKSKEITITADRNSNLNRNKQRKNGKTYNSKKS